MVRGRRLPGGDRSGSAPLPSRASNLALGIVVGVLITSLAGFEVVKDVNRLVLLKEPVHLRRPLYSLRQSFGRWEQVAEDPPLPVDQVEELGTHQYISYTYEDRDAGQRGSTVRLHSAYYTGTVDTVPHVPERCYQAGGAKGRDKANVALTLSGDRYRPHEGGYLASCRLDAAGVFIPSLDIRATLFSYYPNAARPDELHRVVYFFIANGKFLPTPDHVRFHGFDPRDRYSYYCKVEMGLGAVASDEVAVRRASEFLSTILPEIMACLPDWRAINRSDADGSAALVAVP